MRIIKKISEAEMVALFLKAEINSPRFRDDILDILQTMRLDRTIIDNPDINHASENISRRGVLSEFRGYKRNKGVFKDLPDDVEWYQVALRPSDLEKVKYIDYPYWVEIAGGTRSPIDAARRVKAKAVDKGIANWICEVAAAVEKGEGYPEIILVSNSWDEKDLVVLEGHLRITCYLLKQEYLSKEVTAILGYSKRMKK